MNVAFIVPYPKGQAPSQRFRFEQQLQHLKENKIQYQFFSFLSEKAFSVLYKKGHYINKVFFIVSGFFKRFLLMFRLQNFDFVFIHREASPIGPPIFEWIIAKILKKKIIYDFDDAIWLTNTSESNKIIAGLKWHSKVSSICKWAYKISCGNDFLKSYASEFNDNVHYIPTTVDTDLVHNKIKFQETEEEVVIGWTGTHSTISYLYEIEDLLYSIQKNTPFTFRVISNKDPEFKKLEYRYIAWQKNTEIADLLDFNIGIMPLSDNKWSKGKCGFKAIQYMALGIPAIVSAVGVNDKVVDDKINGFVCSNISDWQKALDTLITSQSIRNDFGEKARAKIIDSFSKNSQEKEYLSLFDFTF